MADVALKDLVKVYGLHPAVRGIDLYIPDEAFAVIVGPSGCGKSTTLRMIAGLETISHGELRIGGRVVNETPSRERGVAMVFQTYALYPHMTTRQNLAFSLKLSGMPRRDIERRITDVAKVLELAPYLDRKPANLSGGQRQRVAMGRAIVREPEVFLFDEPLSNLDAKLRNQMRVEIKRLQRRLKATTVYVTHDQIEAMTLADIIVVMNDGRIAQAGTPMEVFEHPADRFVAGFIGTPQMNFLEGELLADGGGPVFVGAGFRIPLDQRRFTDDLAPGARVTAGIRPEDIVPQDHGAKPRNALPLSAGVNLTEMLGNETLLFLTVGGTGAHRPHAAASLRRAGRGSAVQSQRRPRASVRRRDGQVTEPRNDPFGRSGQRKDRSQVHNREEEMIHRENHGRGRDCCAVHRRRRQRDRRRGRAVSRQALLVRAVPGGRRSCRREDRRQDRPARLFAARSVQGVHPVFDRVRQHPRPLHVVDRQDLRGPRRHRSGGASR